MVITTTIYSKEKILLFVFCIFFFLSVNIMAFNGDSSNIVHIFSNPSQCVSHICNHWQCEKTINVMNEKAICTEFQCTRFKENTCLEWKCIHNIYRPREKKSCSSWNCVSKKGALCVKWTCNAIAGPAHRENTCATYNCNSFSNLTCSSWNCASFDMPGDDVHTCAHLVCTKMIFNSCEKWQCISTSQLNNNLAPCIEFKCLKPSVAGCLELKCLKTGMNENKLMKCTHFSCKSIKKYNLPDYCLPCEENPSCASNCCYGGQCLPEGDPKADEPHCVCAGGVWEEDKCCLEQTWCGTTGYCARGEWKQSNLESRFYCTECIKAQWVEEKCCGANVTWLGNNGDCINGYYVDKNPVEEVVDKTVDSIASVTLQKFKEDPVNFSFVIVGVIVFLGILFVFFYNFMLKFEVFETAEYYIKESEMWYKQQLDEKEVTGKELPDVGLPEIEATKKLVQTLDDEYEPDRLKNIDDEALRLRRALENKEDEDQRRAVLAHIENLEKRDIAALPDNYFCSDTTSLFSFIDPWIISWDELQKESDAFEVVNTSFELRPSGKYVHKLLAKIFFNLNSVISYVDDESTEFSEEGLYSGIYRKTKCHFSINYRLEKKTLSVIVVSEKKAFIQLIIMELEKIFSTFDLI